MKLLIWNVRGIHTSLDRLRLLVNRYQLHILVVIEPKVRPSSLLLYLLKLGFPQAESINNDSIWIFWRYSFLRMDGERPGVQNHSICFCWLPTDNSFWCTFVYGLHTVVARCPLWEDLSAFCEMLDLPWLLGGDFNTFLTLDEHKGI